MGEQTAKQSAPFPSEDPFVGTPFRAVSRLASGAMGEIFLVEKASLGKEFVAKVLHHHLSRDVRILERVRVEAECLGALEHANIVVAVDFNRTKTDDRPFLVMEYLRGRTLDEEIAIRGPMPPLQALDFTLQLLSALGAAHALGIVHRDIKPSNLFLCTDEDGRKILKVLDFGIARILPCGAPNAPEPSSVPTSTGELVGTPSFMSPEAAECEKVDCRADLYAAALMLFVMLTGRGPFDELKRDTAMLAAHTRMRPPPPSKFAPNPISTELDAIVNQGLRKNPAQRYQTAEEFQRAVERCVIDLQCPTALRETTVLGSQWRLLSRITAGPEVTASNGATKPDWYTPARLVAVSLLGFVLFAVATAILMLALEAGS